VGRVTHRVITDPNIYRHATAHHEAGHAVLDIVTGLRFRYITLRPRDRGKAGHVLSEGPSLWWNWYSEAASAFAGVVAEDMWWFKSGPPTDTEGRRRILTRQAGRTDMVNARDVIRAARERTQPEDPRSLALVAPPWTVERMAVQAWSHAIRIAAAYNAAITDLADLLLGQRRAVTWTQAREVVHGCTPLAIPDSHLTYFMPPWFLEHSRLRWQARDSSCTPMFAEPVAARNTQEG
jgi:hypothetical protein